MTISMIVATRNRVLRGATGLAEFASAARCWRHKYNGRLYIKYDRNIKYIDGVRYVKCSETLLGNLIYLRDDVLEKVDTKPPKKD